MDDLSQSSKFLVGSNSVICVFEQMTKRLNVSDGTEWAA
jgi:hypothetical protein